MKESTVRSRVSGRDRTVLGQLTSFVAIGALSTCVDFVIFNFLMDVVPASIANQCGYLTGMIAAWLLNSRYTFGSASRRLDLRVFLAANVAGLLLTTAAVQVAVLGAPDSLLILNVTKLCAGGGVMLFKFVAMRMWTEGLRKLPLAAYVGGSSDGHSR